MEFYHDGMRELQDCYEGRGVADRLARHRLHATFTDADRAMIESTAFFFLATGCGESVDCSFKGGMPGFVRIPGPGTLEFPDYDGNRMYRSLGNILRNPRVGMLFMRFDGQRFDGSAARMRVNGGASIDDSAEAVAGIPGAKRMVRVMVDEIFPNCPRYIPRLEQGELSVYAPRPNYSPPEPEWKSRDYMRDAIEAEKP